MQTFLPFPEYYRTFAVLDHRRLGNQVYREGLTLVRGGWPHHPASKMWRGYEHELCKYCLEGLCELTRRNRDYPNHYATFTALLNTFPDTGHPPWMGDERLHSSHRAALLFKDPDYYGMFGWQETPKLDYYWPSN